MTNSQNKNTQQKDNMTIALERIEKARRTSATTLDLSELKLKEVPEDIWTLTKLQALNLSFNRLNEVPQAIGRLTRLQRLYLNNNELKEVPEAMGQLTQLGTLYLNNNALVTLPAVVKQWTKVQWLDLSSNKLAALPDAVRGWRNLQQLDLSNNKLTTLPDTVGQWHLLEALYLNDNKLTTLPEIVEQWHNIQVLHLDNNQLTELPTSFKLMRTLTELYLHGNDRLGLPTEILGRAWSNRITRSEQISPFDILEYYFRTRGDGRPLNEAKLILVGRGGVGKTSLVNRLVYDQFESDEKKTEGIQITEWPIQLNGNEDVRLHIWDFGGQEILHATHQFFLTQRSVYLLVLSGREGSEDEDAEYWLKLIESFGGESPIIVVLNKIKEYPFDLNRRALQQKYPAVREFVQTDCKDRIGIEDLRKFIDRETDNLAHLRDAFPASWFDIKDHLARRERNYMDFNQYRACCARYGEADKAAQDSLAGYLHQLGIVLNYKDDPRLQDTHVLNPHWVTTGIYKILNSEKLAKQKGEIHLNDASEILDTLEYPAHMRRFIFDLMKKFDLCFAFPNDECHYLVPELLDKQEPEETVEFEPKSCLNFQYRYPILPEGLLPRFTVRTHHLSENIPRSRWRTGVILEFEGNKALVKADVSDKKVIIYVSGSVEGRRRLLTLIRFELDSIHRGIRNLQPQEMIPLPDYSDEAVPYHSLRVMEEKGIKTLHWVAGDDMINLDVKELLNGVDLTRARKRERTIEDQSLPVRVFYSYSHKDERFRSELETHLKLLYSQGLIESWHDRKIEAGEEWKDKIDTNLERADIILLLISADFIASAYCSEKEMKHALERHEKGEARVIPIILRTCNWQKAPFSKFQALPRDAKAITSWSDRDKAWTDTALGIEQVVETIRKGRGR